MSPANAIAEYVDASTGRVVAVEPYRDPGLDETSWYAREQKARGVWHGPHLSYGCGRPQ